MADKELSRNDFCMAEHLPHIFICVWNVAVNDWCAQFITQYLCKYVTVTMDFTKCVSCCDRTVT